MSNNDMGLKRAKEIMEKCFEDSSPRIAVIKAIRAAYAEGYVAGGGNEQDVARLQAELQDCRNDLIDVQARYESFRSVALALIERIGQ